MMWITEYEGLIHGSATVRTLRTLTIDRSFTDNTNTRYTASSSNIRIVSTLLSTPATWAIKSPL